MNQSTTAEHGRRRVAQKAGAQVGTTLLAAALVLGSTGVASAAEDEPSLTDLIGGDDVAADTTSKGDDSGSESKSSANEGTGWVEDLRERDQRSRSSKGSKKDASSGKGLPGLESAGEITPELASIAKEIMGEDGDIDANTALNVANTLTNVAGLGMAALDSNRVDDLVQSGIECGMGAVELGVAVAPVAAAALAGGAGGGAVGGVAGGGLGAVGGAGAGAAPGAALGASTAAAAGALAAGAAALGPAMPGIVKGGKTTVSSCTTFAGNGLGMAGYMLNEYRSNKDLPQAIDFIAKLDPKSSLGGKIVDALGGGPEAERALASAVDLGREMDKADYGDKMQKYGDTIADTGRKVGGKSTKKQEKQLGVLAGESSGILSSFISGAKDSDSGSALSELGGLDDVADSAGGLLGGGGGLF